MQQLAIVGIGGACGAIARYTLSGFVHNKFPKVIAFPIGTLAVNVLGCLLIGVLMAIVVTQRQYLSRDIQLLLITGFLGSLTTFSTFGYETIDLIQQSNLRLACWNVAANLLIGCAAVFAGHWLTKSIL